jgi:hypothetical protein
MAPKIEYIEGAGSIGTGLDYKWGVEVHGKLIRFPIKGFALDYARYRGVKTVYRIKLSQRRIRLTKALNVIGDLIEWGPRKGDT